MNNALKKEITRRTLERWETKPAAKPTMVKPIYCIGCGQAETKEASSYCEPCFNDRLKVQKNINKDVAKLHLAYAVGGIIIFVLAFWLTN